MRKRLKNEESEAKKPWYSWLVPSQHQVCWLAVVTMVRLPLLLLHQVQRWVCCYQ